MSNLLMLMSLYESGVITDEHIKEFIEWHKGIVYCSVCNKKLMHDDEAYQDSLGAILCDAHSVYNEETNMYESIKI